LRNQVERKKFDEGEKNKGWSDHPLKNTGKARTVAKRGHHRRILARCLLEGEKRHDMKKMRGKKRTFKKKNSKMLTGRIGRKIVAATL